MAPLNSPLIPTLHSQKPSGFPCTLPKMKALGKLTFQLTLYAALLLNCTHQTSPISPVNTKPSSTQIPIPILEEGQLHAQGPKYATNHLGNTRIYHPDSSSPMLIHIKREWDNQGNLVTLLHSEKTGPFILQLPEPQWLQATVPTLEQITLLSPSPTSSPSSQLSALSNPNETLRHRWLSNSAYFWKAPGEIGYGNRINNLIFLNSKTPLFFKTSLRLASETTSHCSPTQKSCYHNKEPILLIHGYTPYKEFGGGKSTWGDLPNRLLELGKPSADTDSHYILFEFRWATASHFEDTAADLATTLYTIAQATGHQIHIVAHSLGGILVRTYLQNLATHAPYQHLIASATTLGTPHSGLTAHDQVLHDTYFNQGQDPQGAITSLLPPDFCQQVSCYQLGKLLHFTEEELFSYQLNTPDQATNPFSTRDENPSPLLFDIPDNLPLAEKPGKFLSVLTDLEHHPLPSQFPLQLLMGLTTQHHIFKGQNWSKIQTGDTLISYAGQRFTPQLTFPQLKPLLDQKPLYGAQITEKILGFPQTTHPNQLSPHSQNSPHYWGYRHEGTLVNNSPAQPMARVHCANRAQCEHATFQALRDWLQQHPAQPVIPQLAYPYWPNSFRFLPPRPQTISLKIKLIDAKTQQPLPFSWVRIYQNPPSQLPKTTLTHPLIAFTKTDRQGLANLKLTLQSGSNYYVQGNAWGYQETLHSQLLTVTDDLQKTSQDLGTLSLIPLAKFASLNGQLLDKNNHHPISHVPYLVHNQEQWRLNETDETGYYHETGLKPGICQIYFLTPGHSPFHFSLLLENNEQATRTFKLP